jgi:hypothetical protein
VENKRPHSGGERGGEIGVEGALQRRFAFAHCSSRANGVVPWDIRTYGWTL